MFVISDGRIVGRTAAVCTTACEDSDSNEASAEAEVENDGEKGEECDAAQEEGENDGERGVDHRCPGHTLDCFLPIWNGGVAPPGEDYEHRLDTNQVRR